MIDSITRLRDRVAAPPPRISACAVREHEGARGPLVLLVEDHAATRQVISAVLDVQGYQVVCVSHGLMALQWLQEALLTGRKPAAILLDLVMPVMNGADFLAQMRALWPIPEARPPVILMTVDLDDHDDLACTAVVPKPFHVRDLLAKLAWVLADKRVGSL